MGDLTILQSVGLLFSGFWVGAVAMWAHRDMEKDK